MTGERGFTLLEMLAALAVFALCATALLGAFGFSARSLHTSAQADSLSQAAFSVLDSLDDGPLQPGRQQGQWGTISWECHISVAPALAGPSRLLRLDLSLRQGTRAFAVSTLRARAGGVGP